MKKPLKVPFYKKDQKIKLPQMKKEQTFCIVYWFKPYLTEKDFKITDKLDKKLENIAKEFGFKFEGSGFDFKTWKRDLSFYKKISS